MLLIGIGSACPDSEASSTSATTGDLPPVPTEPAAIASLCGQEGSLRIAELTTDRVGGRPLTIGDRVLFTTFIQQDPWEKNLRSFRLCEFRSGPMIAPPWPEVVLVHTDSGSVVALDPEGVAPAVGVASGIADGYFASVTGTDVGILDFRRGDGAYFNELTFYRYTDTDTPGLEFVGEVAPFGGLNETVLGDEVFFGPFNPSDVGEQQLLRVSLPELEETVVASPAGGYEVTESHLVLLRDGEVRLIERESGDETVFAVVRGLRIHSLDDRTLTLHEADWNSGEPVRTLLVDLESGARHAFAGVRPEGRAPDGRWVLSNDVAVSLGDPLSGDHRVLAEELDAFDRVTVDGDGAVLSTWDGGALRLVPYAGGDVEVLAARAGDFQRLSDGRVVTRVSVGRGELQALVVVDRGTLVERLIDTHVVRLWSEAAEVLPPDVVAYQVDDGERSGLYLVNLGDAPSP
jgi:hypothetical protein